MALSKGMVLIMGIIFVGKICYNLFLMIRYILKVVQLVSVISCHFQIFQGEYFKFIQQNQ